MSLKTFFSRVKGFLVVNLFFDCELSHAKNVSPNIIENMMVVIFIALLLTFCSYTQAGLSTTELPT
jgi:hypothetical protein